MGWGDANARVIALRFGGGDGTVAGACGGQGGIVQYQGYKYRHMYRAARVRAPFHLPLRRVLECAVGGQRDLRLRRYARYTTRDWDSGTVGLLLTLVTVI